MNVLPDCLLSRHLKASCFRSGIVHYSMSTDLIDTLTQVLIIELLFFRLSYFVLSQVPKKSAFGGKWRSSNAVSVAQ